MQSVPEIVLMNLPAGACLTLDALEGRYELSRQQISNAIGRLVVRGLVERAQAGCYQLTKEGQLAKKNGAIDVAPRNQPPKLPPNNFPQRIWSTMRMSGVFTIGDLVTAANWPAADAEARARVYVRRLKSAGYVIELPTRQKGVHQFSNGFKRFRLIRNTGPFAPAYKLNRNVMRDDNLREEVPCASRT